MNSHCIPTKLIDFDSDILTKKVQAILVEISAETSHVPNLPWQLIWNSNHVI